jgi:hypothetical protein
MRKILLMTTGLAWLALTGAAGAAVTVTLTPGPLDPLYFEPEAVGLNHFSLDGIVWTDMSGAADTERGNVAGVYAAPEGMGASTTTGTTYMAVEGGGTETATFATPQTRLSLYWGSIDGNAGNVNSISISMGAYTLTGTQLATMFGADDNGNQGSPLGNQLVTITGLTPFTTASFSSTGDAFEFSLVGVPEPSTWAMMAIGFAAMGFIGFRRTRTRSTISIT